MGEKTVKQALDEAALALAALAQVAQEAALRRLQKETDLNAAQTWCEKGLAIKTACGRLAEEAGRLRGMAKELDKD